MSFLQNIFGGGSSSAPATPATPAEPAAPATGESNAAPAPANGQPTNTDGTEPKEQVSPLDAYKDLWNNEPKGNGENGEAADPLSDPSSLFNIDPKSIQEAVGKINFADSVTPEHLQAITEGGEGAQKAFMDSMNAVARQVFSQSMVGSAKLVEQAIARSAGAIDSRVESRLRTSQVSESVAESNPAFKHPAAKPMVQALQQQLAAKHPTASSKEISDMANAFFKDFADTIGAPEKQAQQKEADAGQMDWDNWLETGNS